MSECRRRSLKVEVGHKPNEEQQDWNKHIFDRLMFGKSSCGGRTYPVASGTHNTEISILEIVIVQ